MLVFVEHKIENNWSLSPTAPTTKSSEANPSFFALLSSEITYFHFQLSSRIVRLSITGAKHSPEFMAY